MARTSERESARQDARTKAQAKKDSDLGLSPPDYIDSLKDRLRRKNSVSDDEQPGSLTSTPNSSRTRSFSEPQSDPISGQPQQQQQQQQRLPLQPLQAGRTKPFHPLPSVALSDPQLVKKEDVIGSMFLSSSFYPSSEPLGGRSPSSPLTTSPPQSPRSVASSKSSSYLWAGLSPDLSADSTKQSDESSPSAADATSRTVSWISNRF